MKKLCIFFSLILLASTTLYSQNLIIKGRVKCENPATNSTRGAENIIIVPGFNPVRSTFTETKPKAGFFELNTQASYKDLIDKELVIYIVSRCENCSEIDQNQFMQKWKVFVNQRTGNTLENGNYYMILKKDWKITKKCEDVELYRRQQDSLLKIIQNKPPEDLKNAKGNVLMGSPALSSLLTTLISVVPKSTAGIFNANLIRQGKIAYGNYLLNSSIALSVNTGFNFSPSRDLSEAVFWNSSAIAFSRKNSNVSLATNFKSNLKLSAYTRLGKRLFMGTGVIYTRQNEFRPVRFKGTESSGPGSELIERDSVQMKLDEYSFYLTSSVNVLPKLNLGVSLKSIHQSFNIPNKLLIGGNPLNIYLDSLIKKQNFDVDVSAAYQVTNYLQLGITAMNILGSELYADAFLPGQKNITYQNQRSLGIGLCYKVWRFNVGSDVLFTQEDFYDASFGVNFVPFNNGLLSGGYTLKKQSYSVSFRIKYFRIAYINDNNLLLNELRKPISPIFNGRIYGGFSFDF